MARPKPGRRRRPLWGCCPACIVIVLCVPALIAANWCDVNVQIPLIVSVCILASQAVATLAGHGPIDLSNVRGLSSMLRRWDRKDSAD